MSIIIRNMKMPPEELDTKRTNKEAREGVVITALPGRNPNKIKKGEAFEK